MPIILQRRPFSKKDTMIFKPGRLPNKRKIKKNISTNISCKPVKVLLPLVLIHPNIRYKLFFLGQSITQKQNNIQLLKSAYETLNLEAIKVENELLEEYVRIEQFIRTTLKRFIQLWMYKKYKNRKLNTEDPATLCIPEKPVYVYDTKIKGVYTFEAVSLRKSIENNLTFTDWMFPEPIRPRNPFTNISFTNSQFYEIVRQLRTLNMTSWWLEAYMSLQMNINVFTTYHKIPLKLNNLNTIIRNKKSEEYIENLTDFIEKYFNIHEIQFLSHLIILKWAVIYLADDEYMQKWSDLLYEFIKIGILNNIPEFDVDNPAYDGIYSKTLTLLNKNNEIARIGKLRLLSIVNRRRPPPTLIL
jgi:hypothetical protein